MQARLIYAAALTALPFAASGQDYANSILVLDASGSMWGQIEGVTKIEIAQGVVGDLLNTLPESQRIGLTAYGHRTRGDCSDIETLVQPGDSSRAQIAAAVNALQPRGKTPMTDAVVQAAEALKYTEEAATVILVSDGIETCNPDPCAAARALEQAGINLTVHVVGFDVTDPEARRQMQCLADETGGQFLSAGNATELGSALEEVTQAAPSYTVTFVAIEGENGPQSTDTLMWDIQRGEEMLAEFEPGATLTKALTDGRYSVSVMRPLDESTAEATFDVSGAEQTVTLVLPSLLPDATVSGPAEALAGATIPVDWTGPNTDGDYIDVSPLDDTGYINYAYTRDGTPAQLVMPPEAGDYEIRYIMRDGRTVLATQAVTVTPAPASIEVAETAPVGATIPVTWEGPNYDGDYISVAPLEEGGYINYAYTRDGSPAQLVMPPKPGTYEVRYVMRQDRTVLASRIVEVTEVAVTLDAAETAAAGAALPVTWDGPNYDGDYISVAKPGDNGYEAYAYTRNGSPASVTMPAAPGTYELRYVMRQDRTVLASRTVEVGAVSAALDVAETARAGAPILVGWEGPGYEPDYISVSKAENEGYDFYAYTRNGNPALLQLPIEPGDYEIRYIAASDGKVALTRKTITLTPIEATVEAPATAPRGGRLGVTWEGPDYKGDFISVAVAGDPDNKYAAYTYTSEDSPLQVKLPDLPGNYEVRYVTGQDKKVLARQAVTIE